MPIEFRAERPGDAPAVHRLITRAFGLSTIADLVVALRDRWPTYDPRLSILAVEDDRPVAHVLMLPARLRLLGRTVHAVCTGPVCVDPDRQRRGLGGEILAECGRRAAAEGFEFSFLHGHPTYYPRHGYVACHGFARIELDRDALPAPAIELVPEPVQPADLPWLRATAERELADVDFGWLWPEAPGAWTQPGVSTVLWWTADGRRAAYVITETGAEAGLDPKRFWILADDVAAARAVIGRLRPAQLDNHPSGWLARTVLADVPHQPRAAVHQAAMACPLRPGALDELLAALAAGRAPGALNLPLPFALG